MVGEQTVIKKKLPSLTKIEFHISNTIIAEFLLSLNYRIYLNSITRYAASSCASYLHHFLKNFISKLSCMGMERKDNRLGYYAG